MSRNQKKIKIMFLKPAYVMSVAFLLVFMGCSKTETDNNDRAELNIVSIPTAEIIVSVEANENIANPTQISAFENGFLLYDHALKQVLVFSENGEFHNSFGSGGKGPGEFQTVSALSYKSGQIIVSDSELLRLTAFDIEGDILSNQELAPSLFAMDNAILSPSQFITPTNGREGGLAKFVDTEKQIEVVFGEPVTETPEVADFNKWRKDFSSGKVPDFFRNRVAISGDGTFFYLFLQTEGVLAQYNHDGALNWQKSLDLPEFKDEFERFLERNRTNTAGTVYMLQYVSEMEQHDDGVYMLLRIPNRYPPTLLFLGHSRNNIKKIQFNGMDERPSRFSISPDKKWIWFLNVSAGIVYRAPFMIPKE